MNYTIHLVIPTKRYDDAINRRDNSEIYLQADGFRFIRIDEEERSILRTVIAFYEWSERYL